MIIILDIVLLSLLFACVLYILHLRDENRKSEKERTGLAMESSSLAIENKDLRIELGCAHAILIANGIIAPIEDLDNITTVEQEAPRCKEIDLKKAYFEAWELTRSVK